MYTLTVEYLGKTYTFGPADSITLVDRYLVPQFGKVVEQEPHELYTRYVTRRGAEAWMESR